MDWTSMVTLVLLFAGIQYCTSTSDAICGNASHPNPCPPAFPDWVALFPRVLAALGPSAMSQLQNESMARARDRNITSSFCSFCVNKVNVSTINARLYTSDPVDIEAICYPVTTTTAVLITTLTATGNRPTTTGHAVTRLTSTASTSTSITLGTTADHGTALPAVSPLTPLSSSTSSTGTVTQLTASTPTTQSTTTQFTPSSSTSAETSLPPRAVGQEDAESLAKKTVVTATVSTLVIVPVALLAGVIVACYACRYYNNKHGGRPSSCSDVCCHHGKTGEADITPVQALPIVPSDSRDQTLNRPAGGVPVVRNFSAISATSTTQLIGRSDSRVSEDSSISVDMFPSGSNNQWMPSTPVRAAMNPFDRKLETVDESFEPPSTGRKTDPIQRRTVPPATVDPDWQRTMPSTNRRRRDTPSAARHVSTTSEVFPTRTNDGSFDGNRNWVFQQDDSVLATGNGSTSGGSNGNIDDDGWMNSVWEKFDDAEQMAIEVEMGSQAIVRNGDVMTKVAPSVVGDVATNQPADRDLPSVPSGLLAELI